MTHECKSFLLSNAARWGLPAGGDWSFFFHNNYHTHHSNINLLWFHNGSRYPRAVTKVFQAPDIPNREFDNLQQAYRCAPNWVPKPLHCGVSGKFWMLWLEGVPGGRQYRYTPLRLSSMIEAVAGMHAAIKVGGLASIANRHRQLVCEPLEAVAGYGKSTAVRRGCDELAARATARWMESLPEIPQHGDLFIDNLVTNGKAWHVVDWESFGNINLPFYDLFTLLISVLNVDGEMSSQWKPDVAAEMPKLVADYTRRLDLGNVDVSTMLPLTLLNWFYLQWSDGRTEFAGRMYKKIQDYFENPGSWDRTFGIRQ